MHMNRYTIIEDCSPYYIRFKHDGLDDVINFCKQTAPDVSHSDKTFVHHKLSLDDTATLLSLVPMHSSGELDFKTERVSLFLTSGGRYYRAHKDGLDNRVSINYTVSILDDKCVTSWYSDDDLKEYPIDNLPTRTSRECSGFVKENHTPVKSMIAKQNECILFNTELFHDFDNRHSTNLRIVLTLRLKNQANIFFDDVKEILFGKI